MNQQQEKEGVLLNGGPFDGDEIEIQSGFATVQKYRQEKEYEAVYQYKRRITRSLNKPPSFDYDCVIWFTTSSAGKTSYLILNVIPFKQPYSYFIKSKNI